MTIINSNKNTIIRNAQTTPIKIGQFATIYKRPDNVNMPFDSTDDIEFIIIKVADGTNKGQFVFDKKILIEKRIITNG
ncbi:MAG: MepB family protein, partial [Elusimicrobia bacterium]|nr:MepB family protein [Elusimicrobiota bacterium]